jgi:hypothetical protein
VIDATVFRGPLPRKLRNEPKAPQCKADGGFHSYRSHEWNGSIERPGDK